MGLDNFLFNKHSSYSVKKKGLVNQEHNSMDIIVTVLQENQPFQGNTPGKVWSSVFLSL